MLSHLLLFYLIQFVYGTTNPPSLDELCGNWVNMEIQRDPPVISNFQGSVAADRNILSVNSLVYPPFAHGDHSALLSVDGIPIYANASKWCAYQIFRRANFKSEESIEITTSIYMPFEQAGIFFGVNISQNSSVSHEISIDLTFLLRNYGDNQMWNWIYETPSLANSSQFQSILDTSENPPFIMIQDLNSSAFAIVLFYSAYSTPFSFTKNQYGFYIANWNMNSSSERIHFLIEFGESKHEVFERAKRSLAFIVRDSDPLWEARWQSAFTPNGQFPGNLPTLETEDEVLSRLYYMSALTLISSLRTNMNTFERVYITGFGGMTVDVDNQTIPNLHIGATFRFFWDTAFESTLLSLLDPDAVKTDFLLALTVDFHKYFGVDTLTGNPGGYYYAANDFSLFSLIDNYVKITGDFESLQLIVGSKIILEWMLEMAVYWKNFEMNEFPGIADYGGNPNNFLECVPTYIHGAPFLNAANVYMMKKMSDWCSYFNNSRCEFIYGKMANDSAAAVLQLYVGGGFWGCQYPNGSLVPVRHVIDYNYIGICMEEYLSEIALEMGEFLQSELLTPNWLRALSLKDKVAPILRPDHGSDGSYVAWPALAAQASAKLIGYSFALNLTKSFAFTTFEGPFGQADQIGTPPTDAPFKTVSGYTRYFEVAGGSFADVIIKTLFGFQPQISSSEILVDADESRGFTGTLHNVNYRGNLYRIDSTNSGLVWEKETVQ